jgi:hypothetical protein
MEKVQQWELLYSTMSLSAWGISEANILNRKDKHLYMFLSNLFEFNLFTNNQDFSTLYIGQQLCLRM